MEAPLVTIRGDVDAQSFTDAWALMEEVASNYRALEILTSAPDCGCGSNPGGPCGCPPKGDA